VVRLSGIDNAHVSSCSGSYTFRICCSAAGDDEPPRSNITSPPESSWHSSGFYVNVTDNDNVNVSNCQYMINSSDVITQPWTARNCNESIFVDVSPIAFNGCYHEGNDTCVVSVNSTDDVGNPSVIDRRNFSIDMSPAQCTMHGLPKWSKLPFNASWNCSDAYSGISYYDVQINDSFNTWANITQRGCSFINDTLAHCDGISAEDIYHFRARAIDRAGNVPSFWSSIANTTVDLSNATADFDEPFLSRLWINTTSFNVNWSGNDNNGIDCFEVQWRNTTGNWAHLDYLTGTDTSCTTSTWIEFNDSSASTTVDDNITYYFRVRARDVAGNPGAWKEKNMTVDTLQPEVIVTSNQIGNSVNITSSATDNISGVDSNVIFWSVKVSTNSTDCGSAPPYGGVSTCSVLRSYPVSLIYGVTVTDRAGNSITRTFLAGRMINFGLNNVHVVLGSSYTLRLHVRSIENGTHNITLKLSGTYPSGLATFMNLTPWEFDYDLAPDKRELTVYNMEQYNYTSFFVAILSSDIDEDGGTLIVNASSTSGRNETDSVLITVSYPVIFPGLNDWAVLVLIAFAVGAYYVRIKE
jgi:hypothetical protein